MHQLAWCLAGDIGKGSAATLSLAGEYKEEERRLCGLDCDLGYLQ